MGNGNKMNLKGRRELYLTVNLNPDTTWRRRGPIFREVGKIWLVEYVTLAIRLLIRHDSKSCNRYTTASSVINQGQHYWPCQKGFFCKRIEEHKQERVNTQSKIAYVYEAKIKVGVQELDSKGLIDTVEEIKNGGPGSL